MARREEYALTVRINRTVNGFLVSKNDERGCLMNDTSYVANDYAHLTEILKELLGPVEAYPEHTFTHTNIDIGEIEL